MIKQPPQTTLTRLKAYAAAFDQAHKSLQTEFGVFPSQKKAQEFGSALAKASATKDRPPADSVHELIAKALRDLDEFSGMWKFDDGYVVRFTDEGWVFHPTLAADTEYLVRGAQAKYALLTILITLKTDEVGLVIANLVSVLLVPALNDAAKFCRHFAEQIEASPFK